MIYPQDGNIWVVSVGIGTYENPMMTHLDAPANQAHTFANLYIHNRLIDKSAPTLTDSDATKQAILRNLKRTFADPDNVKPEDMIIFYYSGHGTSFGNQIGICPYDYFDQEQLITDQEIITIMQESPAKHKVCFIEACKSDIHLMAIPSNKGIQRRHGKGSEGSLTVLSNKEIQRLHEKRSNIAGGLVYITSTRLDQKSYEFPNVGGLFSYSLFEAISGQADANKDRILTTSEVFDYLKDSVSAKTKGLQVPQINDEGKNLAVPIFTIPDHRPPATYFRPDKLLEREPVDSFELRDQSPIYLHVKVMDKIKELEISMSGSEPLRFDHTMSRVKLKQDDSGMFHHVFEVPLQMSEYRNRQVDITGKLHNGNTFFDAKEIDVILYRLR